MRYTQIFEKIFLEISVPFDFHLGIFSEWFAFGISTIFGFFVTFPWKFPYHLSLFRKF